MEKEVTREKLNFAQLRSGLIPVAAVTSSYTVKKADVLRALESSDLETLRQQSQYFYAVSGEYRRLVEYYGKLFLQQFVVVPRVKKEDMQNAKFLKVYDAILAYVKNAAIEETNLDIATLLVRDGAFYGYEREVDGITSLQQLPTSFCRSRYKLKGVYLIEFNMKYFDNFRNEADLKEILNAFPAEFGKAYRAFKSDPLKQWAILDPKFTRAHIMWDGVPLLAPVMLDIIELSYFKNLEKTKSGLDLYKLLVQKIPLNKDNEITMLLPEIKDLHDNFRSMISNANIDVITTPAEVELIDLVDKNQAQTNGANLARDFVYNGAGASSALFNSGSGTGSIGLDASIKADMSLMSPFLRQTEKWFELKFSEISPKFEFGMIFLPTTYLNLSEMSALYKEGATLGFPTKTLAASCYGLKQYDMDAMLAFENEFLDLPTRMIPASTSYAPMEEGTTAEGGRPASTKPLSDEGQKTKDQKKNEGRA